MINGYTAIDKIMFPGSPVASKIMVENLSDNNDVLLQNVYTDAANFYTKLVGAGTGVARTNDLYLKSGTDEDENLTFDAGNEAESRYFFGGAGIDTITGYTADDWLYGQAGDDTFIGGGAAPTV